MLIVRRHSDPGGRGSKRKKLNMDEAKEDDDIVESVAGSENTFNLFGSSESKLDWDEHPRMADLMETGKRSLDKIGFSSPKPGTNNVTMYQIAKAHNIQLPRTRADAEPILLRKLAIVRIKQLDRYASEKYENKKEASK